MEKKIRGTSPTLKDYTNLEIISSNHLVPALMTNKAIHKLLYNFHEEAGYLFWIWQAGYWLFFCVVNFITLTLWYSDPSWPYIVHTLVQAVAGLMLSLCLYPAYIKLWYEKPVYRISAVLFLVVLVSLIWTLFRMDTFIRFTGETHIWEDFGGWYHASIFIFLCWACMFHGTLYYFLLEKEHHEMLKAEAEAREEQVKRMQAQTVARDAQIKMLRYQLNPHFLCNTLNAINSLVEAGVSETAQDMTVKLSRFLRYSLDNNPDTKVLLEKEVSALNLYLDIEKTRFAERLQIDSDISEEARVGHIPSLILQPVIENSMKYAISKNEEGGVIGIKARVENGQLVVELWDTGSGDPADLAHIDSLSRDGVGIRNTEQRLRTLYEDNFEFKLSARKGGGLQTTIRIPYQPGDQAALRKIGQH